MPTYHTFQEHGYQVFRDLEGEDDKYRKNGIYDPLPYINGNIEQSMFRARYRAGGEVNNDCGKMEVKEIVEKLNKDPEYFADIKYLNERKGIPLLQLVQEWHPREVAFFNDIKGACEELLKDS